MFNYIFQDFKMRKMPKREVFIRLFIDRGVSAVLIYRLSSWCWKHNLRLFAIFLKQLNISINHCDIAYQAEVGKGMRIFHSIGIVISACKIGDNFSIYQNVTIGRHGKRDENGRDTPIIGNNVICATGCVVAGPIYIGDNAKVGANTVVLKNIPSNTTAIGAKAKIIS